MTNGGKKAGSDGLSRDTLTAQALGWTEPAHRGVVPAIYPSAPYERDADGRYPWGHSYTRDQNPTYDQVEALLAKLEGGVAALLFASGMAAATTIFEVLEAGTHVVAPREMYWTIRLWLERLATAGRIRLAFAPNGDLEALDAALTDGAEAPARLVWIETPANPSGAITDLLATVAVARRHDAITVADGTLATPVLQRPLDHGVDLVVHSATKQLNGHSDVVAGALVAAEASPLWERIRQDRGYRGAILGPFEAWLLQRGMRTLALRVARSADNALAVARHLDAHPAVVETLYPGLPGHPGHAVAARQMCGGFGPVVAFRLAPRDDLDGAGVARRVASRLELFRNATSLGGVESLVEHRAPIEGAGSPVPPDLLRLSIGIEAPADLTADLDQALEVIPDS